MPAYPSKKRKHGTIANGFQTAMQVYKTARRAYNTYSKYKTANKAKRSGVGITGQHDKQVQYRKRWMPKYKKRKWVNFVRRVTAVADRQKGRRTFVFNRLGDNTTTYTLQGYMCSVLYGRNGVNESTTTQFQSGMSDLYDIFNQSGYSSTTKLKMLSACLDLTYSNKGTAAVEMDLYEVAFNKATTYPNFKEASDIAENDTTTVGTWTALNLFDRGVTLFDIPQLIRTTGMQILKKTKVFVPSGGTTTYQMRDASDWFVTKEYATNSTATGTPGPAGLGGFILPKKTKGVIAVYKTVVGSVANAQVACGVTHRYSVKFDTDSRVGDGFQ